MHAAEDIRKAAEPFELFLRVGLMLDVREQPSKWLHDKSHLYDGSECHAGHSDFELVTRLDVVLVSRSDFDGLHECLAPC